MYLSQARLKAHRIANRIGETAFVIVADDGEDFTYDACQESYLDSAEFAAFDGEVIEDIEPITCAECGRSRCCECSPAMTIHELYAAFGASDDAWMTELRRAFPGLKHYGDLRYTKAAEGEPGTALRAAYDAFRAAGHAWREALPK